jgi:hypothetical protein
MSETKPNPNDPVLFMISPEKIEFHLDTDNITELSASTSKISKESEIKIINKSEDFIAIKIKTANKNNYIMTPASLIISPKEESVIKIRFNRDEGEKLELKSHRILFEGFTITPEEKDQDPNDLYSKYIKGKIKVPYSIKARTKFFDKNQGNISTIANSNISKISEINSGIKTDIDETNKDETHKDEANKDEINKNEINKDKAKDITNKNETNKNEIKIPEIKTNKDETNKDEFNKEETNKIEINKDETNKNRIDIYDLTKASNRDIIIALVLALFIGLFVLN